jgi:hypothetical protein
MKGKSYSRSHTYLQVSCITSDALYFSIRCRVSRLDALYYFHLFTSIYVLLKLYPLQSVYIRYSILYYNILFKFDVSVGTHSLIYLLPSSIKASAARNLQYSESQDASISHILSLSWNTVHFKNIKTTQLMFGMLLKTQLGRCI